MQHVPSWLQCALLPDRWNVAGVSCGVLTVWHHFALGCAGNPYLWGGEADHNAAAELLLYCSGDYAAGKRLFAQPFWRNRRMRRIARTLRRQPFDQIDAACRDYVRSCLRTPQHVQVVSTSAGAVPKPAKSPLDWVLVQFLCAGNPSQIRAAWDTPYATAQCLFDAHRDITGECDSLEDMEQERRMDERAAERAGVA
jgi:hypothetical protein